MDTFKDRQMLDTLCAGGDARWQVWKHELPPLVEITAHLTA
jgi:hypothetical protein